MFRAHYVVFGSIQGVGYRSYVKRIATLSKINGYVKNMLDGTVEVVAEAETREALDDFRKKLYKHATGFDSINVDDIAVMKIEEVEKAKFSSFEVRL